MHDLNTINRLNNEAFAASIHRYRTDGRFVLAKYEGLHLVSIETFSDQVSANAALDTAMAEQRAGARTVLFTPVVEYHDAARNQSEDRAKPRSFEQPAEIGQRSPDVTLGDYINRKIS